MIRRTHLAFEDHYTQAPNQWVRDTRLSRRARGLLVELLSHRAGWNVSLESLVEAGPEGRDAIRSAVAELEKFGYLQRQRQRTDDGKMAGMDYLLVDPWESSGGKPNDGLPQVGEPTGKKTITQEDQALFESKEEQVAAKLPTGKKKTPILLPRDFTVTAEMKQWCADNFPAVEHAWETQKFCTYHQARGSKMADWSAAWRNWMVKAAEYQQRPSAPQYQAQAAGGTVWW